MREELLRGRIDPVHVFDDEDDRPRFAHAKEELTNGAKGPLLELGTGHAIEKFRWGRHPEEVGKQDGRLVALEAKEPELFDDATPDAFAGHTIGEIEVASQYFHDRAIRHRPAIGGAGGLQLYGSGPFDPPQEFVEQTGLADAWFASEQHDAAVAPDRPLIDLTQMLDLGISPDQRGQAALLGHFQPCAALDLSDESVDTHGIGFALHLELAQVLEGEVPVPEVLRTLTHHDLAWLRQAEQSGGQVRGVPDRRVVHA